MAEQTSYLCTVLVDPSASYISLGTSQEWFLQLFGLSRLSCKNTHNGIEKTQNVSLETSPWIQLFRCPMLKVLGLTDVKSGLDCILAIRIFIQPNFQYSQGNSLEFLLQENILQDILESQPPNHVFVEYRILNCNDRTLRKYTRIAQDAFKAKKITTEVSESCPQLVSQMIRYKERFCLPNVPLASSMNLSQIDYSLSFNWTSQSVVEEPMTTKSVLPACITIQTSQVSFTEASLLLSWDVSREEHHPQVITDRGLILDQSMLIVYHQLSDSIQDWISKCEELGISYAHITGPQMPAEAAHAKVFFIEAAKQQMLQDSAKVTAQTYTYMLRLQNDFTEIGLDIASQTQNPERSKRVYFQHLKKTSTSTPTLSDVPLAWCEFGIVCEDLRNLRGILLDQKSPWKPHLVLRDGFGDCVLSSNVDPSENIRVPKIIHGLSLEPPKKWIRSARLKHVHVSPEASLIKWAQIIVKSNSNMMNPEDDISFQDVEKTSICIRGNPQAIVSLQQAEKILDEHFAVMPKHSIAQYFQKIPGTLRKRTFSLDAQDELEHVLQKKSFDCNICQETYDFTKHAMTYTLCGHTFCIECGNQVFKAFQNFGSTLIDGTKTVDCPCCRCSLSVFDTLRILNDDKYSFNYVSNIDKAVEAEKISLQGAGPVTRRSAQKVTFLIVSCEKDPDPNWHSSVENNIHTLFLTHVNTNNLQKWQIQILKWIASSKKTNRLVIFGHAGNSAVAAFKQLFTQGCLLFGTHMPWTYILLFAAGVITSILNHSLTNRAIMWVDRGLMIFIVSLVMIPLVLGNTPIHLVHVQTFFACIHFLWSKLNSNQEDIRIDAHKTSHQDGTMVMFAMGLLN